MDFGRAGAERLKRYHFALPEHRAAVIAEAARVNPGAAVTESPAGRVLFAEGPCSGYIIQRAYDASGLVRHKVYRCFPYEREATGDVGSRALAEFGITDETGVSDALLEPRFGTTSVGVAFSPRLTEPEYVSVYQCLLRGDARP